MSPMHHHHGGSMLWLVTAACSIFYTSLAEPTCTDPISCASLNHDALTEIAADSYDREALHLLQTGAVLQKKTVAQAASIILGEVVPDIKTKQVLQRIDARLTMHRPGLSVTIAPSERCNGESSNAAMDKVALTVPCIMIVVFAVMSAVASRVWRPPPANARGSNMPRVTRLTADGNAEHINWHFVPWSSVAIAMANVNYVVVLPAAVENFTGSFLEAGVWVGLYACGALMALPYFVSLGHHWSRLALVSHAVFTVIGNVIMVVAAYKQSLGWLYFGRIVTGFAGSYKYSCDHGCLHLIPVWDRIEAIFITRMSYAVGFALGPSISPICDWILIGCPWLLHIFPTYNSAAEAGPLVIMSVYGLIFLFASLFCFRDMEILDAAAEGISDVPQSAIDAGNISPERRWVAIKIFISTNVTNFTRIFIRVAWEAGALVVLVRQYCIDDFAGLVLSMTAITLVVSRNAMSKLSIAVGGDNAKLMRVFEWTGLLSCPFLFRIGPPTEVALGLFLTGSIVFYNSNSAQSGVLLALGSEVAIPGHRWLSKKALNVYYFISNISAYIFGPITSFVTQQWSMGQNTVACLVVFVTLFQVVVTYTTVRPKAEFEHENSYESSQKEKQRS